LAFPPLTHPNSEQYALGREAMPKNRAHSPRRGTCAITGAR